MIANLLTVPQKIDEIWKSGKKVLIGGLAARPSLRRCYKVVKNAKEYSKVGFKADGGGILPFAKEWEGRQGGAFYSKKLSLEKCKIDKTYDGTEFMERFRELGLSEKFNTDVFQKAAQIWIDATRHETAIAFEKAVYNGDRTNLPPVGSRNYTHAITGFGAIFTKIAAGQYQDASMNSAITQGCLFTGGGDLRNATGGQGIVATAIKQVIASLNPIVKKHSGLVVEMAEATFDNYLDDLEAQYPQIPLENRIKLIYEAAPIGDYLDEYLELEEGNRGQVVVGCYLKDNRLGHVKLLINDAMTESGFGGLVATLKENLQVHLSVNDIDDVEFATIPDVRELKVYGVFEACVGVAKIDDGVLGLYMP